MRILALPIQLPLSPPVAQAPVVVDEATLSAQRWALAYPSQVTLG